MLTPLSGFQSSWMYPWCDHHRGSHEANSCVKLALVTVPRRNDAKVLPVFGTNGACVPPKLYVPPGGAPAVALYRVRISWYPILKVCLRSILVKLSSTVKSSPMFWKL